jgi:hypothetical protein
MHFYRSGEQLMRFENARFLKPHRRMGVEKPKQRFAWERPIALLSTTQGIGRVGKFLIQFVEGLAL